MQGKQNWLTIQMNEESKQKKKEPMDSVGSPNKQLGVIFRYRGVKCEAARNFIPTFMLLRLYYPLKSTKFRKSSDFGSGF